MGTTSIDRTLQQERALLDSRIESVTALVDAVQRAADPKEQLAEAEREDKRAYVHATRDSWSTDELKKLGLNQQSAFRSRVRRSQTETAGVGSEIRER